MIQLLPLDVTDASALELIATMAPAEIDKRANVMLPDPAVPAEMEARARLPDSAFALVLETGIGPIRKLAVNDADATSASRMCLDTLGQSLPAVVREAVAVKIAAAERKFSGQPALPGDDVILAKTAKFDPANLPEPTIKIAFAEEVWGVTIDGIPRFPLHDADLVKMAATMFNVSVETLEPAERREYAVALTKRAAALDMALPDGDWKHYSGDGTNRAALKAAVAIRKVAAGGVDLGAALAIDKLIDEGAKFSPETSVALLTSFDKYANLAGRYNRDLPDPYASVYEQNPPAAPEDPGYPTGASEVALQQFLPDEHYKSWMIDPRTAYNRMPNHLQRLVAGLAAKNGGQRPGPGNVAAMFADDAPPALNALSTGPNSLDARLTIA